MTHFLIDMFNKENDHKKFYGQFRVGDSIKVHYRVKEGEKERIQLFEGVVIAMKATNFVVRKISHEVGVERTFPYSSEYISKIEVTRKGRVRRAKLYYLRDRIGKHAKVKELKLVKKH